MAVNAKAKINTMFGTDFSAEAFDYLARERKPINFCVLKTYLGASVEDTHKALTCLEKNKLVKVTKTGISDIAAIVSINADGLEYYKTLEKV